MKPAAPVTRIGSSGEIIKESSLRSGEESSLHEPVWPLIAFKVMAFMIFGGTINRHGERSAQAGYRLLVCSQPLFKNYEAEEDLVIVMPLGGMLLEQFPHNLRAQKLVDP